MRICLIRPSLYCLNSLLQEVTAPEIQIATCLMRPSIIAWFTSQRGYHRGNPNSRAESKTMGPSHLSENSELVMCGWFIDSCLDNAVFQTPFIPIEAAVLYLSSSTDYKECITKTWRTFFVVAKFNIKTVKVARIKINFGLYIFKLRDRSFYISLHRLVSWSVGWSVGRSVKKMSKKCQKLSKKMFRDY